MILKNETASRLSPRLHPAWAWGLSGILLVIIIFLITSRLSNLHPGEEIRCGAEQTEEYQNEIVFVEGNHRFLNGQTRSLTKARTGLASSLVTETEPFGINWVEENLVGGMLYKISVWRKASAASGILVGSLAGEGGFYRESKIPVEAADGWEKLRLFLRIPEEMKGRTLKIYVYGNEFGPEGKVYFDDLIIERSLLKKRFQSASRSDTTFETLDLLVPPAGMLQLEARAREARKQGVLVTTEDSWVTGKILQPNNKIPVRLRLKGDWTDHLTPDNWSFRIRTRLPETWERLHTFSVQRPETRFYLHEWVFHQLLGQEGLLSTRYDFVHFRLNGTYKGVYAYEEHFEKILVEAQERREGPIVKLDEAGLWNARKRARASQGTVDLEREIHAYESAAVLPFQEGAFPEDSLLWRQFLQAQTLLEQFQYESKPGSEVFDARQMGRYYALVDLTEAYHNLIWHNLRFYFNPVTVRLEPIGFDGYTEVGKVAYTHLPFIGSMGDKTEASFQDRMHPKVFRDRTLVQEYIRALYAFSEPEYWATFLLENEAALERREALIQIKQPDYRYNRDEILIRARQIRTLMFPVEESAIRAYHDQQGGRYQVRNFHLLPLEIVGFGAKGILTDRLTEALLIGPYDQGALPQFSEIARSNTYADIFYRLPGLDSLYTTRILPWPGSSVATLPQQMFANLVPQSNDLYTVAGTEVLFHPTSLRATEDILIPKGYQVRFAAGTTLALEKGAAFISYSPVFLEGTEENPIVIHSPDQSGQGFTVIQADIRSDLHYVRFEHLNTLARKGWTLTGAVTFYESDVDFRHCAFVNNHCEDALNTVRSEFLFENSLVSQTAYDGFDADFCRGTIRNSRFFQTGNDGMDFSGSKITVHSAEIEQAGDKGISVGEGANIYVEQLTIDGANIGVACKDLSEVRINDITLKNCKIGFAAYQKKPEFGSAKIWVAKYSGTAIGRLHQIESGSALMLVGTTVKPI